MVLAGAGVYGYGQLTGDDTAAPGTAFIFVDDTGGVSTCQRAASSVAYSVAQTANNICDTLSTAYSKLSSCSDTIIWKGGTYSSDEVTRNASLSGCGVNATATVATGETVSLNGTLEYGARSGATDAPPNNLTVDGCDGTLAIHSAPIGTNGAYEGGIRNFYNTTTSVRSTDNIFRCIDSVRGERLDGGEPFYLEHALRVTFDRVHGGPGCCGSVTGGSCTHANLLVAGACSANSPVGMRWGLQAAIPPTPPYPPNDGITVKDSTIQDIDRTCASWPSADYGTCPSGEVINGALITQGARCPDLRLSNGSIDTCHVDGVQIYGALNTTFIRNTIYNVDVQALFFGSQSCTLPAVNSTVCFGGTNLIAYNFLGVNPIGGNCGFCVSVTPTQTDYIAGTWTILRNTSNTALRFSYTRAIASGTAITFQGNIGTMSNNDGASASCTGGTGVTWTYAYNWWDGTTCNATDHNFDQPVSNEIPASLVVDGVSGPNTSPDFHLAASTPGVDGFLMTDFVPAVTSWCAGGIDIDGTVTPLGAGCEAGADEIGGTSTSGASQAICTSPCTAGVTPSGSSGGTNFVSLGNISDGVRLQGRSLAYSIPVNLKHDGSADGSPAAIFSLVGGGADCGGAKLASDFTDSKIAAAAATYRMVVVMLQPEDCNGNGGSPRRGWVGSSIQCGGIPSVCPDASYTGAPTDMPYLKAAVDWACSGAGVAILHLDCTRLYLTGGSSGGGFVRAAQCDNVTSPSNGTLFRGFAWVSNEPNAVKPGGTSGICPNSNKSGFTFLVIGKISGSDATTTDLSLSDHLILSFDHTRTWWSGYNTACGAAVQSTAGTGNDVYDYTCTGASTPLFHAVFVGGGGHSYCELDDTRGSPCTSTTDHATNGWSTLIEELSFFSAGVR